MRESNSIEYSTPALIEVTEFHAPKTIYCKSKQEFDDAVGSDFIDYANRITEKGEKFLVGLSHGQSPSGAYEYILNHYSELKHPESIHYTFINSKLERQRGLVNVRDAISFVKTLLESNKISKDQILGRSLDRNNLEKYCKGLNSTLSKYFEGIDKQGLDYVFIASTSTGQVAGISRNSTAFESNDMVVVVNDSTDPELTFTPSFINKSGRVAFLATKAEKRRPLAWLFYRWGKPNESPSFLRFIDGVENKMTVFIDDRALTWPQVVLTRKTDYGDSSIRVDMALPYNEKEKTKLPVVLMIHGFLGLNTFDSLLAFIPSHKYISAAMHYGSIPYNIRAKHYSQFVVENVNHVVNYFGGKGHSVYIFDHSMANTYMLMLNNQIDNLPGIQKYLKGRISSNPFFGREAKHAATNFLDNVILKSNISTIDKIVFRTAKNLIPIQSKEGFRNTGIRLSKWLIKSDTSINNRIWKAIKQRIMLLVTGMDSLPQLNKIPIEHTLNRLPIKIFAIQIHSALQESKKNDATTKLSGFEKFEIPVLILKSEIDPIAKFVGKNYESCSDVTILDITNYQEKELFREHLYYMIHPHTTIKIIDKFIEENS